MTVLWFAFGIYILGIALVLFLRPTMMFRPGNGTWKEFGISNNGSYTVFPFWLFTLVWALLSYVFATLGTVFFAGLALKSLPKHDGITPISTVEPPTTASTASVGSVASATSVGSIARAPGYYIFESPKVGAPKYVYFGTSPPTADDLVAHA